MKKQISVAMVAGLAVAGAVFADNINGVNIDFVNIGNAGNAEDSTGYGAVGYNYRIGRTEISFDQFSPSGLASGGIGDKPAVNMTWHVAAQYANWLTSADVNVGAYTISAGKVTAIDRSYRNGDGLVYLLPTEDEWYKAAYFTGSGYSLYANGTSTEPIQNVDANYNAVNDAPWAVGSGTPEQNGTFDMMGNVVEWTESAFDGELDNIGEDITYRGGHYGNAKKWLQSSGRKALSPSSEDSAVGMRIVSIPEPGTISLMGLSTMGLFFTRTVRRRKQAGKSLLPIRREYSCDALDATEPTVFEEEPDALSELREDARVWLSGIWECVSVRYAEIDRTFWNRMVAVHDRKVARRTVRRAAFKRRALGALDAFLARVMK